MASSTTDYHISAQLQQRIQYPNKKSEVFYLTLLLLSFHLRGDQMWHHVGLPSLKYLHSTVVCRINITSPGPRMVGGARERGTPCMPLLGGLNRQFTELVKFQHGSVPSTVGRLPIQAQHQSGATRILQRAQEGGSPL